MTKPWPEILAHYVGYKGDWQSIRALATLAQRISEGPLSAGLFAWTSMFDLCIVQTEATYPYNGPLLRVSPVSEYQLEFRYEDTWNKAKQWHRTIDAADPMPQLLKFLDQLRWFPRGVLESLDSNTTR